VKIEFAPSFSVCCRTSGGTGRDPLIPLLSEQLFYPLFKSSVLVLFCVIEALVRSSEVPVPHSQQLSLFTRQPERASAVLEEA
jgi:hypothetical protein